MQTGSCFVLQQKSEKLDGWKHCMDINVEDMKTLVLALHENRNAISKHFSTRVKAYI